jgi:hypothetical protein
MGAAAAAGSGPVAARGDGDGGVVADVALVSVSGGARDRQVTARMARVDALTPPPARSVYDASLSTTGATVSVSSVGVSSFAVEVGAVPGAEVGLYKLNPG